MQSGRYSYKLVYFTDDEKKRRREIASAAEVRMQKNVYPVYLHLFVYLYTFVVKAQVLELCPRSLSPAR